MKKIDEMTYKELDSYVIDGLIRCLRLLMIMPVFLSLFGLLFYFLANPVHAEGTYKEISANYCDTLITYGNSSEHISSTVDSRVVVFADQPTPNSFRSLVYFVTLESGKAGLSCSPTSNLTKYTLNGVDYYYRGVSLQVSSVNTIHVLYPVVAGLSDASIDNAIYYAYGEGASSGPTYDNFCSTECKSFYQNPANSRYGNIQFSSNVRVVFFNDSLYAVSLNSFTAYIGSTSASPDPVSCGTNQANIRTSSYDGNDFYYLSFSKSSFNWYGNSSSVDVSGSSSLAYRYTFGDLAVAPSYNVCNFDYSPVRNIYPHTLVREVANYVQAVKGQYYSASNQPYSVSFYVTRYNKSLDALYSYYLTFDEKTAKNSYTPNSTGFAFSFNELSTTLWGSTAIYDKSITSWYSETNHLQELDEYMTDSYWSVYSKIYPDPSKAFVLTTIFDNGFRGVYGPSAFDFPSSLQFIELERTDFENPYYEGENVKFYYAINETEDYYDYYMLLGLNLGPSSNMNVIYNYPWYLENSDGTLHTDHDFYYALSFLNLDNVWLRSLWMEDSSQFEVGTGIDPDITLEIKDQGALGVTENEENDKKRGLMTSWQNISRNLTEFLQDDQQNYEKLLDMWGKNNYAIESAFNSFLNNQFTSSLYWFSNQLDYLYSNTPVKYLFDASLIVAVGLAIFF